MKLSSKAKFLRFVRILVNETTRDEPMTKEQIFSRCLEEGYCPSSHAFYQYLKDLRQAGIIIGKRPEDGKQRGTMLYWYDDGWI